MWQFMMLSALVVGLMLAAIIVPVVRSFVSRGPVRRRPAAPKKRRDTSVPRPMHLVVNKSDMDRELSALLGKERQRPPD
jgi:hypothetical protein